MFICFTLIVCWLCDLDLSKCGAEDDDDMAIQ